MRTVREKILLAVNNSALKEFLEGILTKQNFEVMLCDPENALKDIVKLHPDLIMLEDDGSSEPDVFDLCYRIKITQ